MLMFQVPWLPEIVLSLNDFSELEALYKNVSLYSVWL